MRTQTNSFRVDDAYLIQAGTNRRLLRVIRVILVLAVGSGLAIFEAEKPAHSQANPIVAENLRPGTDSWRLVRAADDRNLQIKAYASQTSVSNGDRLGFYVSTKPAQQFRMRIYRMGYYDGLGGRLVYQSGWQAATAQQDCPVDSQTGLIRCAWRQSLEVAIARDWTTGIYLAKFENRNGFDTYVSFAVKDDLRIPDFLYQQPVTTYQAYNAFPDDGVNGKNSYDVFSWGAPTLAGSRRAVRLSFNRPMENTGAERFFMHEHDLIMFLEQRGYDIGYQTNIDTHLNPERISQAKAFISPGHDEYWTKENFNAVVRARDNGVHLAFFGANTAFWQIRLTDDSGPGDDTTMEIYKDATIDPDPVLSNKTVTFRALGRPEQTLTGVQYITYGQRNHDADFIVTNSDHWIYQNTGLADGDRIAGIIGIEVDKVFADQAMADSLLFDTIGRSPFVGDGPSGPVVAETIVYLARSGALVFASGTLLWGQGLNRPGLRSEPLRTMTQNLLDRYAGRDENPRVTVSVQPLVVLESDGVANVEVRLSSQTDSPVQFSAATRDSSAQQGVDYYGVYQITDIAAGQLSRVIPVVLLTDDEEEAPEEFSVYIFNVTGAEIAQQEATITIDADESNALPGLSVSSQSVSESVGSASVAVTLDSVSESSIQVEYASDQGDARRGVDYYGVYGVLQFAPGITTQTIEVQIFNDELTESEEDFIVRLFRPAGAKLVQAVGTLTITDDD